MIGIKSAIFALGLSALVDAQITLGTAAAYGVFAASTITNTGDTVISAPIGLDPGTSITGFPPGVNGGEDINDAAAAQAKTDITTAYNAIMASATTTDLTGQDLGGMTLYPGTYNFDSSGGLTGTLTLDAQGDATAQFIFKFGSTLTTASASQVVLQNGAAACEVFWGVGSSATLGTTTAFEGSVIAYASITATTGVTVGSGGLYAMTAAVTLDTNTIDSAGTCAAAVAATTTTSVAAATPTTATTTTTTTATGATVTTTATVTDTASTTTVYITSTATVTSTTYAATTATVSVTSTTTVDSVSTTTLTASACTTTAAAKMAKRAAKKTKTVTTTCAGKTATVKAANKTKWVSATHTATSTHWVTKKGTSTHTTQPACTTKAKRDYQRMFQ